MNQKKITFLCILLILFLTITTGCFQWRRDDPGTQIRTIMFDNIPRTYRIYIPPDLTQHENIPILFVLHGGGGTAEGMENYLTKKEFNTIADEQGIIVIYPDGFEKHWNDGRKNVSWNTNNTTINDVGFLTHLIDEVIDEFNINNESIFFCGISNGGQMSYRMACEKTHRITGVATVVSSLSKDLIACCNPENPIPFFITAGTDDPLVPFDGGLITLFNKTYGYVVSINETIEFWKINNKCESNPTQSYLPDNDPNDEIRVKASYYESQQNGAKVQVYIMEGGGHTWADGPQYFPESIIGKTCYDFNQCRAIWDFFQELI